MITIIHGDDTTASRNFLYSIKEKSQNLTALHASNLDMTFLAQLLEGESLFATQKTIIIEELLTGKKSDVDSTLITYLATHNEGHDIYLWEKKEVTKTVLNAFPGAKMRLFALPKTLFQFLDSLRPMNGKYMVTLLHKTAKATEPEIIFYMLVRQFRLLLGVLDTNTDIEEVKRLAPWQKAKLEKQVGLFAKDHLTTTYKELFTIDFQSKTGASSMSLLRSIDIFLLNL